MHSCHAKNCIAPVHPKMFMCNKHWFMLPKQVRSEVWRLYRPGQEVDKNPSKEYMEFTAKVIENLAEIEAVNANS